MSEKEIKEHQLYISSFRVLWQLMRENHRHIRSKKMFLKIIFFTTISAPFRWIQIIIYRRRINAVDLKKSAPIFVIGHWRSGTTHLHYLMAKDPRFSHLEAFQAFFFRVALISQKTMKPLLNRLMPKTRPQDNILINAAAPTEEEHPLTNLTHRSAMHSFFFPKNQNYFTKYHLFRTSGKSILKWKRSYESMLKEISFYNGQDKRLLLKNPHNTARIKVLLELFPEAKFVFIHRNPYEVFQSTTHLYKTTIRTQFLNEFNDTEIKECVLNCYELVMKQYLELKERIPKSQLVEISYDDITKNPIKCLEHMYDALKISEFESVKPIFNTYLAQQKNYKKNNFKALPEAIRSEVKNRWGFAFKAWNYPF